MEQGPTITMRRSSSPHRILDTSSRPRATVWAAASLTGSSSSRMAGGSRGRMFSTRRSRVRTGMPRILARRVESWERDPGRAGMAQAEHDWHRTRRQMTRLMTPVNLGGAVLVFVYFHWIDYNALTNARMPTAGELVYFVVAFAALVSIGYRISVRWSAPLREAGRGGPLSALAQRRALQLPFMFAGVSAI